MALVLALMSSVGAVIVVMGLLVGARAVRPGAGSAVGYLISAAVHIGVGGVLVTSAFAALRRVRRGPPPG